MKWLATAGTVIASVSSIGSVSLASEPFPDLQVLIERAERHRPQLRRARAEAGAATARRRARTWALLPSFRAEGSYTRNQIEAVIDLPGASSRNAAFVRRNQVDALLEIRVPLIDVSAWNLRWSAISDAEKAAANLTTTRVETQITVVQAYYSLAGATEVLRAATQTASVAARRARITRSDGRVGLTSRLEVQRARADLALRRQDIASTQLAVRRARQRLETLTGIELPASSPIIPYDELQPEAPLQTWIRSLADRPQLRAAQAEIISARSRAAARRYVLLPRIDAAAQERLTNAPGFGQRAQWSAEVRMQWALDPSAIYDAHAADKETAALEADAEEALQTLSNRIEDAWWRIETTCTNIRAAEADVKATRLALTAVSEGFRAGTAAQLELLEAERDLFLATVERTSYRAELAAARAELRILSGQDSEL